LSTAMSSTWFRVTGGAGMISATKASICHTPKRGGQTWDKYGHMTAGAARCTASPDVAITASF
jgi:hypothetical protein